MIFARRLVTALVTGLESVGIIHFRDKSFSEERRYFVAFALCGTFSRADYNVKTDRHQKLTLTVSLSDNTPCPASLDSISHFFTCGYADTIYREFIFTKIYQTVIVRNCGTLIIKSKEILIFVDFHGKKQRKHRPGKVNF